MREIAILYYHRVNSEKSDYNFTNVTPQNFNEQMQVLAEEYEVIPIKKLFDKTAFDGEKKGVIITFDDGYCDVLYNAYPILREYGYSATCFITTENIDTGEENWTDFILRAAYEPDVYKSTLSLMINGHLRTWETNSLQNRMKLYWDLRQIFRESKKEVQKELRQNIAEWGGFSAKARDSRRILNKTEILELKKMGMEIGSHSVSHPYFSDLSDTEIEECITESKHKLEIITDETINYFSYPFGDCPKRTRPILDKHHFILAATSNPGTVTPETDIMYLPRNEVRNYSGEGFRNYLRNSVF